MDSRIANRRQSVLLAAGLAFLLTAPAFGAEGRFERTLHVSGPVSLHIQTGSGDVTVRTGNVSTVTVVGTIRAGDFFHDSPTEKVRRLEANPPIEQMGDIIRVGEIRDEDLRRNVSISYEVTTPPETYLDSRTGSGNQRVAGVRRGVNVSSGSGNVTLTGLAGRTELETGSGDVEINGVQGRVKARTGSGSIQAHGIAGAFWGHTGSGDVTVEEKAAEEVEVETGSGEVRVQGARKALKVTTGSGSVHLEGQAGDAWEASTGSGDVVLELTGGFDLLAHTQNGSVTVGQPLQDFSSSRHETRGKAGGGGNPVRVNTGSGDIRIE